MILGYRRSRHRLIALSLLLGLFSVTVSKVQAVESPVNRVTDSADSDLISRLLSLGLRDTALDICELRRTQTQSGSDDAVRWLIEWARVKTAYMLHESPESGSDYIDEVQAEIDLFIANHPLHPRQPWLQLQRELIELADARRDLLIALVKPTDHPSRDASLKQIVGVAGRLQELSKQVESLVAIERNKNIDSLLSKELVGLAITVASHRIESLLLRGELFEEGSDDFLASANQSLAAAQQLLDSLPSGAEGRLLISQQQVESLRRTGDLENAARAAKLLWEQDPNQAKTRSIAARVAIDLGELAEAKRFVAYDSSESTKDDLELELVRLQLDIASALADGRSHERSQRKIADRIQSIGKQHGDYARRRAEHLVLGTSLADSVDQLDPRIIIAQAASHLREGAPEQAAQLLDTAARSSEDASAAVKLAVAGAAAFQQATDNESAARLLREVALAHFTHPDAAKLHLQSVVLLSEKRSADAIIEYLEESIRTWPIGQTAISATDWLIRLHDAKADRLAAARAATSGDVSWMTVDRIQQAKSRWIDALLDVPPIKQDAIAEEAIEAFAKFFPATEAKSASSEIVILFGDRDRLSTIDNDMKHPEWMMTLLSIRRGGEGGSINADGISDDLRMQAIERLILDGRSSRLDRKNLGQAILSFAGDKPSLQLAQGHGWLNDWDRAISTVKSIIQQHAGERMWVEKSAVLLAQADNAKAKRFALELWSALSSQLRQGSDEWHHAKLSSLTIMKSLGDDGEAAKAANFILLTQPNVAPEWKTKYQAFTKQ